MLSREAILLESSSRLQSLFTFTKGMYTRVKNSNKLIEGSCLVVEPYIISATVRLNLITEPALSMLNSSVSNCIEYSSVKLGQASVSLAEKKKFYKASAMAWVNSKPKNFSEFSEALKSYYPSKWTENLEIMANEFYYQSLKYQPKEILKLVADLLSEGSETLKISLEKAKNFEFAEYFEQLKEMLGDKYNEQALEAGKIFKSLLKIKEKLVFEEGFAQDWSLKAKKSAELASLLVLAGADELYFWTLSTFDSANLATFTQIKVNLPFKGKFLAVLNKLQTFDKQDLLDSTWPEDYKNSMSPIVKKIGLEDWVESNWYFLDNDEDGIVSLGDLVAALTLFLSDSLNSAMKLVPFKVYMLNNGEA